MSYLNLVKACESAWSTIRQTQVDVPDAVVVIGSGGRMASTLYGHFAKETWEKDGETVHEVLIVAEQLHRSAEEIFTTLLHEACHGIAHTRGIKDCSGKRHNKKFAEICSEVGMLPPEKPHASLGYSAAVLSEFALEMYAQDIERIAEALKVCRKLKLQDKEKKKTSWSAVCQCDRKITVGKKIFDEEKADEPINIACTICGGEFEVQE